MRDAEVEFAYDEVVLQFSLMVTVAVFVIVPILD